MNHNIMTLFCFVVILKAVMSFHDQHLFVTTEWHECHAIIKYWTLITFLKPRQLSNVSSVSDSLRENEGKWNAWMNKSWPNYIKRLPIQFWSWSTHKFLHVPQKLMNKILIDWQVLKTIIYLTIIIQYTALHVA